jgi:hypothetical protein
MMKFLLVLIISVSLKRFQYKGQISVQNFKYIFQLFTETKTDEIFEINFLQTMRTSMSSRAFFKI